jgi:ornithine decarboxylase
MFENFFTQEQPATPCLILDVNQAQANFDRLQALLPEAKLFYAIKANPHPEILKSFILAGGYFDAASIPEIELVLSLGARPERICYGNIAKKKQDIKTAYELGVERFVADSEAEIVKIASVAPKAKIYFRIATTGQNAVCPLSQKFGSSVAQAKRCIILSRDLGLEPFGIAFHVGSQQLSPKGWESPIRDAGELFAWSNTQDIELKSLDLGGGFPVPYHQDVPGIEHFTQAIEAYIHQYFPSIKPEIVLEPGRYLVATAGTLFSEVVLVSSKFNEEQEKRWVYLDVGVFGGLAEAADNMIIYAIESKRQGPKEVCALAGPSCDSMDIMYREDKLRLPSDLEAGDIVQIKHAGAYTTTYASIGFNGFAPLTVHCLKRIPKKLEAYEQE